MTYFSVQAGGILYAEKDYDYRGFLQMKFSTATSTLLKGWFCPLALSLALSVVAACGSGGGGSHDQSQATGSDNSGDGGNGGGHGVEDSPRVGSLIVATSAANGTDLSAFIFDVNGKVNTTPGGNITIPSDPPPDTGCGGTNFKNRGYDKSLHLLFLLFTSGSSSVLCAYSVDPTSAALAPAFNFPAGSGVVSIDPVNHVAGYLYHQMYTYNATGITGTVTFNVIPPGGTSIIEVSLAGSFAWYGSFDNGLFTLQGVCPFKYTSGTGYASSGDCAPFTAPISPAYADIVGRDTGKGLYFTRSAIDQSSPCSNSTQTTVYLYTYDPASGVFGNPASPAHQDLGFCSLIASDANRARLAGSTGDDADEQGDIDAIESIFFGLSTGGGLTITPYAYTGSSFAGSLPSVTVTRRVRFPVIDPVNHLLLVLTGTDSAIDGVTVYPYTSAGLGAPINNSIGLANPAAPTCSTPPCVQPLLAVMH